MVNELCDECGLPMEARREGSTQGLFCQQCGWRVITSYIPEIDLDQTDYEVRIVGGDYTNKSHIKAVAAVSARNFLDARQLLEQQPTTVVFKGKAPDVQRVRGVLAAAGLSYEIEPPFSHDST